MLDGKHTQSIGNNSSGNNQAEGNINIYNHGLSYEDVKSIYYDLFEQNFYKFCNVAREIVDQRCKEFNDMFLNLLMSKNREGLNQAIDPDFLFDIFIAQRDFARCGDPELADILITLLIERTKEPERSLPQIVLNESIATVSKLTKEELDILTALFVVDYYSKDCKFDNIPDFANYIATYILPFWNSIKNEGSLDAHLSYAGCGFHESFGTGLEKFLESKYKGPVENITNLRTSNIKYSIEKEDPRIKPFFYQFNKSILNHMYLTTVGIAIGYANLCNITGEEFNLSKWL